MTLGQKIKQIRLMRGLTQEELAEKAGLSGKSGSIRISQYESDKRKPNDEVIKILSEALDISPYVLISSDFSENDRFIHYLYNLESNFNIKVQDEDDGISIFFPNKMETDVITLSQIYEEEELLRIIATLPVLNNIYGNLYRGLEKWAEMSRMKNDGSLSTSEYDEWKLKNPR